MNCYHTPVTLIESSLPNSQALLDACRRLFPAQPIPGVEADTKSCTDVELLTYLERYEFKTLSKFHVSDSFGSTGSKLLSSS